ncbi:MAG: ABC transporter permease [Candidatus Rokubacteria bacterium]|nr:ABC transporter permease [Candidatus Rokubacteria bacterium]
MVRLIPGDPASLMLGPRGTPEDIERLRSQLRLDEPLHRQYGRFLQGLANGELGRSIRHVQPVARLMRERLPVTVLLLGYSALLAVVLSVPLAFLGAVRPGSMWDQVVRASFTLTLSMPAFWIGLLLLLLLSLQFGLFPVSGIGVGALDVAWHLFLPALTMALSISAILIRNLRGSIAAILTAEYIRTARAKGLPERSVLAKHVLRNAALSAVTVLGVHMGWLVGGTVVVETVFAIPGLGSLMVSSIYARDYPVVQGITLAFAALVILINLATDLSYRLLDPRVQLR